MIADGFLRRTQQAWKVILAMIVIPGAYVAVMVALLEGVIKVSDVVGGLMLSILPVAFAGLAGWAIHGIACPSCGSRILWKAIKTQPLLQWWDWLEKLQLCPSCGSTWGAKDSPGR